MPHPVKTVAHKLGKLEQSQLAPKLHKHLATSEKVFLLTHLIGSNTRPLVPVSCIYPRYNFYPHLMPRERERDDRGPIARRRNRIFQRASKNPIPRTYIPRLIGGGLSLLIFYHYHFPAEAHAHDESRDGAFTRCCTLANTRERGIGPPRQDLLAHLFICGAHFRFSKKPISGFRSRYALARPNYYLDFGVYFAAAEEPKYSGDDEKINRYVFSDVKVFYYLSEN